MSAPPVALAIEMTIIWQTAVVIAALGITARKEPWIPSRVLQGATRESTAAPLKRAAYHALWGATSPLRAVQTACCARWDASQESRRRAAPHAPRVATALTVRSVQVALSDAYVPRDSDRLLVSQLLAPMTQIDYSVPRRCRGSQPQGSFNSLM
eukprot:3239840-Prymnesium_polylepis.1